MNNYNATRLYLKDGRDFPISCIDFMQHSFVVWYYDSPTTTNRELSQNGNIKNITVLGHSIILDGKNLKNKAK